MADRWNAHWPDEPKTLKNVSYWEVWPSPTGHEPSLAVLDRLALLYECSVTDLLADLADYRHLDTSSRAQSGPSGGASAAVAVLQDVPAAYRSNMITETGRMVLRAIPSDHLRTAPVTELREALAFAPSD